MRTTWAVTLTYDLIAEPEELVRLGEELDASVSVRPGRGVDVVIYRTAPDPLQAATLAREAVDQVTHYPPVGVEVVTEDEQLRRADEPSMPELVSAPEVGEMLGGISRQRVYQLQGHGGFPEPLYRLRTGPVWDARAIRAFAERWERRPGRPRRSA